MESGKRYRRWSWEQKQYAVERMKSCSPEQLAKKLGIHKRQLYEWREQFLYLAVVLDAYSRRVVGWALDESLETSLVVAALRKAITERRPGIGLVHHSDRDTQYASRENISLQEQYRIEPGMNRAGRPRQCSVREAHQNPQARGNLYSPVTATVLI